MSIYKKLLAVQTELKAPKNQFNKFGNYNYRSCEDILEALKPILSKAGLALTITDEPVQVGERYYIKALCKVYDGETEIQTTAYAREAETKKGMDESQITGSASSYARKYALNGMFCIDDTKDADGLNKHSDDEPETPSVNPEDFIKKIAAQTTMKSLVALFNANQEAINGDKEILKAFKTKKSELQQENEKPAKGAA